MSNINDLIKFESAAHNALKHNWAGLFEHCNLSTFAYLQFFDDGTFTNLCSDQEWSKKYYAMDKIDEHFFHQIMKARSSEEYHVYFWPQDPSKGEITSWLHDHGIGTGFTIFKRVGEKVHGWGFSTKLDCTDLMNLYLTQKDKFIQFGRQFVMEHDKYTSKMPHIPHADMGITPTTDLTNKENHSQFSHLTTEKTLIFTSEKPKTVSLGIWEVMELLSTGHTLKQIAHKLNISIKTVEQRLGTLRSILGVYTRDKIYDIWKMNSRI